MTAPTTPETPESATEVPDELIKLAAEVLKRRYDSEFDAPHLSWKDFIGEAREIVAAVLPATYKYWFAQAFGTDEEIRAREAEAANRPKDDPIELCERIRPGGHEQRVRAKAAEEIRGHWREWQTARAENDGTRPAALRSSRAWYRLMVAIGEDLNDSQHAVAREMGWDQP